MRFTAKYDLYKITVGKKMREIRNITMNAYAMQSGKSRCDPFRNLSGAAYRKREKPTAISKADWTI